MVDLYKSTGKFDVIAITDHILMKKDLLARAGRLATLGWRAFGVREEDYTAYREDIEAQGRRAWNWPISWTCGRRQTVTTSFPSQVSNTSVRGEQRLPQAQAFVLVEDLGAVREDLAGSEGCVAPERGHCAHPVPQRVVAA